MPHFTHWLRSPLAVIFLAPPVCPADTLPDTGPRLPGPLPTGEWSPPPPPAPLPPARVLRETEYVLPTEGRSIIVQEVEPPPQAAPPLPPVPVPPLTEEERAARLERWKAAVASRPKTRVHGFSCTVYDARFTRVLWWHHGQGYVAWSRIDWNDFAGIHHFLDGGSPATRHMLHFGLGNASTSHPRRPGALPASLPKDFPVFTEGGPDFVIVKGDPGDDDATEGIRLLHALHAREKSTLQAARAQREARELERKAWLLANPPPPRDTIIQFGRREKQP